VGFFDTGDQAWDVAVSGDYAYVADGATGLRVINVSTPTNPQEVGFFDTAQAALGVAVSGNYAYVADYRDGLRVIDVSAPTNPQEVGFYDTGDARGVAVNGTFVYVADGWAGLRVFNVSTPTNPQEVGFFDTGGYAYDMALNGSYVYVADGLCGLSIISNDLITGLASDDDTIIPFEFEVYQNYPNPFNPTTFISYQLSTVSDVELTIYNQLGQKVRTLVNARKPAGTYQIQWDGRDNAGNQVTSGVYLYRLKAGSFVQVRKMVLLR
jgi:hypothetical protein